MHGNFYFCQISIKVSIRWERLISFNLSTILLNSDNQITTFIKQSSHSSLTLLCGLWILLHTSTIKSKKKLSSKEVRSIICNLLKQSWVIIQTSLGYCCIGYSLQHAPKRDMVKFWLKDEKPSYKFQLAWQKSYLSTYLNSFRGLMFYFSLFPCLAS